MGANWWWLRKTAILAKSKPDPEDFGFLSSDALRYAGWEPHHLGAYSKDTDIITDLIAEWFKVTPIVGSYGDRS